MTTSEAPVATSRYRGRSAAERAAERRARLLAAAADVVAAEGVEALRVRALCTLAGLNDRYFYESFSDTDAVLRALVTERTTGVLMDLGAVAEAAPADLEALTRAIVEAALDILDNPTIARLVIDSHRSEALREYRRALVDGLALFMEEAARDQLGTEFVAGPLPRLLATASMEGALELVSRWLAGNVEADRATVAEAIVAMVLAIAPAVSP